MVERLTNELGHELAPLLAKQRSALLEAPALYVDDTQVPTMTGQCYVWVVTNGHQVKFAVTSSREAGPVLDCLTGFKGVLVSDFFPGFDSAPFRQQKCWAHLAKDLNEALWKEPFNRELETFVAAIRDLMVPVIAHFNKYGAKAYHLRQFQKPVERFFQRHVHDRGYESESVQRFRKRFARYEESLFTFLSEDGVSWHNNAAERALRHVAVQRKISTAPFSLEALPSYLVLLSLAQTCRNENRSFLQYLLREIPRFA